jgi:hypothetical protein
MSWLDAIRGRRGAADRRSAPAPASESGAPPLLPGSIPPRDDPFDLDRRRQQLAARVVELQFDLGGMVYEMAIRDRIRIEVIVQHATRLQEAESELAEIDRIRRLEETSTAGACGSCGAPHSTGAGYCWQCGQPLVRQVPQDSISAAPPPAAADVDRPQPKRPVT